MTQKLNKLKINLNNYVTVNNFNASSGKMFLERLKQTQLTTKTDTAEFMPKICFDKNLKKIN